MKIEHKIFTAEVKEFSDEGLWIEHFISTERLDRGSDIMRVDGMKILGRPVVLMAHGFSNMGQEPIAKPLKIWKSEFNGFKGVMARTQFFDGSNLIPPDNTGRRLYEKAKNGFMPNWSIGYIPLKCAFGNKDGIEYREVLEWDLLEWSPVGVSMNPDCQNVEKCGNCQKEAWFKILPEKFDKREFKSYKSVDGKSLLDDQNDRKALEEKLGDLCQYKDGQLVDTEEKPYPNEHACRITDPKKYDRIRRNNDKFGKGIHALWGIKEGDPVELQAIRFSKSKFTAKEARQWCNDHEYKCKPFEPASEKCGECGQEMAVKWDEDVSGENEGKTCDPNFEFSFVCSICEKRDEVICQGCKNLVKYNDISEAGMGYIKCPSCGKFIDQTGKVLDQKAIRSDQAESVKFVIVDGDQVREKNNVDFTMGGNHYAWDFIPEDEIWVEQDMDETNTIATKLHEFTERLIMKYLGWDYNNAHEVASKPERLLRHIMMAESDEAWAEDGGGNGGDGEGDYGEEYDSFIIGFLTGNEKILKRINDARQKKGLKSIEPKKKDATEDMKVFMDFIKTMGEKFESMEAKLDGLAAKLQEGSKVSIGEPAPEDKKDESKTDNPPEPRKITVITEEEKRAAIKEALKGISDQITEAINKVVPAVVKSEFDRLRGKIS